MQQAWYPFPGRGGTRITQPPHTRHALAAIAAARAHLIDALAAHEAGDAATARIRLNCAMRAVPHDGYQTDAVGLSPRASWDNSGDLHPCYTRDAIHTLEIYLPGPYRVQDTAPAAPCCT